jgi:NTE family protein
MVIVIVSFLLICDPTRPAPNERDILTGVATGGRALVLGGGGVTGIAWETGLLAGLAEAGIDLSSADLVVGTSAGSVVGAQILSGVSIKDLYAEQLIEPRAEIPAKIGTTTLLRYATAMLWPGGEEQARARLGRAALKARTVPESERKAVIKQRLPADSWPERRLLITAVDAETGELRVLDPAHRVASARAGHAQSAAVAESVASVWK